MAIDTQDDEVAARALLTAAQADISPVAKRVRAASRFFTRMLIGASIVAPAFLGIAFWRFMQALQGGSWIPFWFAAVGSVVFLLPPIVFAFYDPLADRNSGLAYRCLYDAAMSDDKVLHLPCLSRTRQPHLQ